MHFRRRRSFLQKMSMIILKNTKALYGSGQFCFDCPAETKCCKQCEKIHFQFEKKIRESDFRGNLPKTTKIRDFPVNAHSRSSGNTISVVTFTHRTFSLCCPDSNEVFSSVQMISWTLVFQKIAHQNA